MKHPSQWNEVRVVDGSHIECEGNCLKKLQEVSAHYSKIYKNVDAVYIANFSADFNDNKYYNWDMMDEMFDNVDSQLMF